MKQIKIQNIMKTNYLFLSMMFVGVLLFSCSDKDDNSNDGDETENEIGIGYIEPENDSDPYIFTKAEDNSIVIFQKNQETGKIKTGILSKNDEVFLIQYGESNLPTGAYFNNYYFTFNNYQYNSVSVNIYDNENNHIAETIVIDDGISELIESLNKSNLRSDKLTEDEAFFDAGALGLSLGVCIVGIATIEAGVGVAGVYIGCGSVILSAIRLFSEVFSEDNNKSMLLRDIEKFAARLDCATTPINPTGAVSCVTLFGKNLYLNEDEHNNNLTEIIDLEGIDEVCIVVKTIIVGLTDSSAKIGGEVSNLGCNKSYNYKELGVQWGYVNNSINNKQIDNPSSFIATLTDLQPKIQYCARAYITIDESPYTVWGNYVFFELPFLDLSTYEMNFSKEGGTNSFSINTNLKITDISSTQSWCKISYNATNPETVNVVVEKNTTNEERIATIFVDAIDENTGEKRGKGVLINQTAKEETGFFAGTIFNRTMWIVDVSENTVGTINYDAPQTEWSTVKDELVVTGHKHESDQYNYPKNYETEFYFYGDYVFAGGGYYTSDFSGKIQNGRLVDFDGSALEDNINVKLINNNTLQMKTERTTTEGGSKWVTDYTMTITINSISSISATSIENMTYTSQPKDKFSLQNYIDKSISTSTYVGTPTEFIDIDFDEIFKTGKSTLNKSNSIREREKELINKEL